MERLAVPAVFEQTVWGMHLDDPMPQDLLVIEVDLAMRIDPFELSDRHLCGDRFRVVVPGHAMMRKTRAGCSRQRENTDDFV